MCGAAQKEATPQVKECVLQCVYAVCVCLSSSGTHSSVSLNYTNKLICAGGTPQALQSCLRLRADGALRHNTLLQQGKHVRLVNYLPQTCTRTYTHTHRRTQKQTSAIQSTRHTYACTHTNTRSDREMRQCDVK